MWQFSPRCKHSKRAIIEGLSSYDEGIQSVSHVKIPACTIADPHRCCCADERVVTYFQMRDRPYASDDQRHNLHAWLKYYENAVERSEQAFLDERDLICSRVPRRTHFGRWMQRLGASRLALMGASNKDSTKYYDWNVWKSFGGFWLVLSTIACLLGPLWAMPFANNTAQRLAIVSCATVAFSLLAIFGTTWKPSQRSMLIAGYEN